MKKFLKFTGEIIVMGVGVFTIATIVIFICMGIATVANGSVTATVTMPQPTPGYDCPGVLVESRITRPWDKTDTAVVNGLPHLCSMHGLFYGSRLVRQPDYHYDYECGPKDRCTPWPK